MEFTQAQYPSICDYGGYSDDESPDSSSELLENPHDSSPRSPTRKDLRNLNKPTIPHQVPRDQIPLREKFPLEFV